MDPPTNLDELVDDLDVNIDELTTALQPLLTTPLRTHASTLPLLDKAKLHILAAAAIESLLYSALLTSGTDAKSHPVFAELARLKTYNAKIKSAEDSKTPPNMRLDKGAAARFIQHGIGSSARADLERAEREAKERAIAAVKAGRINVKFNQEVEEERQVELARKRKADEISRDEEGEESSGEEEEEDEEGEEETAEQNTTAATAAGITTPSAGAEKTRLSSSAPATSSPLPSPTTDPPSRKSKRRKSRQQQATSTSTPTSTPTPATPTTAATPKSKKRRKSKKARGSLKKESEFVLAEQQGAPKTSNETFRALLDGSHAKQVMEREEEKAAWRAQRVRF